MDTYTITASELKNNTAEILNKIIYTGATAVIERHGKSVAKIVPIMKDSKSKQEIIDRSFGIMPDFPDVTKFRVNRKKFPTL